MTYPRPWRAKISREGDRRLNAPDHCYTCGKPITKGQSASTTLWERRIARGVIECVTTRRHTLCDALLMQKGEHADDPTDAERADHHWRQRQRSKR